MTCGRQRVQDLDVIYEFPVESRQAFRLPTRILVELFASETRKRRR